MSNADETTNLRQDPAVRNYDLLCVTAVIILFLALFLRGLGWWSVLVLLVGLVGHLFRWRSAPLLVLVTLLLPQLSLLLASVLTSFHEPLFANRYWRLSRLRESDFLSNWILCAAVVGYVAGNYRLRGLLSQVFPPDPRLPRALRALRKGQATLPDGATAPANASRASLGLPGRSLQRRSPRTVAASELSLLLLSIPVWASLAGIGWELLPSEERGFAFEPEVWRGMVLVWVLGLGLLVATSVLGYLGWTRLSAAEATLYLQDVAWRETRREQTRLNRWIAWAGLKKRSRKGKQ